MSDHKHRSARASGVRKLVGVRELKTHAARIVRLVRDSQASYILTHRGRAVGVILPLDSERDPATIDDVDEVEAWNHFVQAGRRLKFVRGMSGVALLSRARR